MATLWRTDATLEVMRERCRNTLAEYLGIELTELGADYLTGTMRVDHRTCQPMRLLHGGASVALAETLGSLAANAANRDLERHFVGQEINANHLRPVPEGGLVIGTARPFHIGASSQVWGIELVNEQAKRICVARITMAAVKKS
jgi:1,4-dihydroxy-2-naphthoyl-CoA hydrolase